MLCGVPVRQDRRERAGQASAGVAWGAWAEVMSGRRGAPDFDPARLRAAREHAELTQVALAAAVGAHPSEYGEWESGRRVPRVETVAALARALQLNPLDLVAIDEDEPRTLQHLRIAAGLSQVDAAAKAGLNRTTYSMLERGEIIKLSSKDAASIAAALGTEVASIREAHGVRAAARRTPATDGRRRGARS